MPRPPAMFSPLVTTRSGECSSISRGRVVSTARRPGSPTTSPMNSKRRSDMLRVYRIAGNLAAMQPDAPPLLEAVELRKSYGSREALKGVSFEARRGELVACIGPNGAGKTTLLTILAAIQPADSGAVRSEGPAGWVPQQAALYPKL